MTGETWILIADSSGATVLATNPLFSGCKLVEEFSHPRSRANGRDIMADDRGRTRPRNKDTVRGAALGYRTPPQEVEATAFSRELAEFLRLSRAHNAWSDLVLVAPPSFLGLLRDALDHATLDCVRGSIAKNYRAERAERVLTHVRQELRA